MGILSKLKNLFRGNKGIGSAPKDDSKEEVQTTFNTDSISVLVEEGVVENVESTNEN